MFDYARTAKNDSFARLIRDSAKKFFLADKNCPLNYEPSGEDFLSPCLGEADMMRRVLPQKEFANWLKNFMPQIPVGREGSENADWLKVAVSPDPSDPKLAHLDGLNLSRAWMLEGILSALSDDDPRRPARSTDSGEDHYHSWPVLTPDTSTLCVLLIDIDNVVDNSIEHPQPSVHYLGKK